jgi:arylsulfatase A-like enzyme
MRAPTRHTVRRLAGLALLCGLTLPGCGHQAAATDGGPHVIVLSIDTLRADHLGCYGYERPTSPHIDALAGDALLYENVHAHSNSTAPSHMTLLSGVLPPTHGVRHRAARGPSPDLPLLAELLGRAGWQTAAFADGGYLTAPFGFARGFDVFDSRLERFDAKLDRIERWLGTAEDRPTMLFVHTYGVHAPYLPARAHDIFTDPAYDGPLAARVAALLSLESDEGRWPPFEQTKDAFWGDRGALDEEDRAHLVDLYDGCLHEVDAGVGRLLDALERKGWLDDAWLVVTSDHGEAFGEHGTYGHRQLYEEELHVPLLVRPPGGFPGGRRVADAAGLSDVAPTLLEAAGLPATGADAEAYRALIHGGRKLLAHGAAGRRELYDLRADPDEGRDLLATAEADAGPSPEASALRAMHEALEGLLADISVRCRALRSRLGEPEEEAGLDPEQEAALRALGYVR